MKKHGSVSRQHIASMLLLASGDHLVKTQQQEDRCFEPGGERTEMYIQHWTVFALDHVC